MLLRQRVQVGVAARAGDQALRLGQGAGREEHADRTLGDVATRRQAVLAGWIRLVVIQRATGDLRRAGALGGDTLDLQQALLETDLLAGVTDEIAGAADDAMTR